MSLKSIFLSKRARFVVSLGVSFSPAYSAGKLYNCVESTSSYLDWNVKKKSFDTEGTRPEKKRALSFIEKKKTAVYKNEVGQVQLVKISDNSYLETTPVGNVWMWKILPKSRERPALIYQTKIYDLGLVRAVVTAFECQ